MKPNLSLSLPALAFAALVTIAARPSAAEPAVWNGVHQDKTLVAALDKPLRQVELEAHFVQVAPSSLNAFGIDWSTAADGPLKEKITDARPATKPGTFNLGYVRGNFQAILRAEVNQNRAKIIAAPRVTTNNNLSATLSTPMSQPVIVTSAPTSIGGQDPQVNLIYITTSLTLTVTPTINHDGTITVVTQPKVAPVNLDNKGGGTILAPVTQSADIITNIRDGDTIALGGLRTKRPRRSGSRPPILSSPLSTGQDFRENTASNSDHHHLIFLTARVLHRADDAKAPAPEVPAVAKSADEKQWRSLRIQNVAPRVMAWWLDPTHNVEPAEYSSGKMTVPQFANPYQAATKPEPDGRSKGADGTGAFGLPEGVEQIVAVDPQNAILVYGTEAGLRQVETIVKYLDKPIAQVEIEAQFVEVDPADMVTLGIDWNGAQNGPFPTGITGLAPAPGPGAFGIGYVRGNLQAALKQMVAGGKAKVISAPRVTAMNNFPASVYTSTAVPVVVGLKDAEGNFRELINGASPPAGAQQFYLTTNFGFTVTPTINNDGTVTVVMQPASVVQLSRGNDKEHSLPLATQTVQTIANIKDGDTIALGGLSTRMMKVENLLVKENDDATIERGGNLIILVTARVVRRAEESKASAPANP